MQSSDQPTSTGETANQPPTVHRHSSSALPDRSINTIAHSITVQAHKNPIDATITMKQFSKHTIDVANNLYPHCIVFGVLPVLTWLIPIIGHLGICDSTGAVHDFAGSYYVSVNDFMTGRVTRYYQLPDVSDSVLDAAIADADAEYKQQTHNLITNNCHHHVACALRHTKLPQYRNMTMLQAWWLITTRGRFSSVAGVLHTWLPFCVILMAALLMGFFIK